MLDTREVGLLKSVEQLFTKVFIPTMRTMDHGWGVANSTQAKAVKEDFISSMECFVSVLVSSQESLQEKVGKSGVTLQ